MKDTFQVTHNPAESRFEVDADGRLAKLEYIQAGNRLALVHTEVPPQLRGAGIASELAKAALEYARGHDLVVVPSCPFVADFLVHHPEYADLA